MTCQWTQCMNTLPPGRYGSNFSGVFFKLILRVDILSTSCEIGLSHIHVPLSMISTSLQAMAECCQATSYNLNQCRPRSIFPHCVTRPRLVNPMAQQIIMITPHAKNPLKIRYNAFVSFTKYTRSNYSREVPVPVKQVYLTHVLYFIAISPKIVLKDPIDNKS